MRLAALFHDIGKPGTAKLGETGIWIFYGHERLSAELTRTLLTRLRYSNAEIESTVHLVREHMFSYTDSFSDSAVRRFVRCVGEENLNDLFDLRRADSFGMTGIEPPFELSLDFRDRIASVLETSRVFSLKDLAVNGRDLLEAGIPGGKDMGIILSYLLETVIDDPELNTKEKLLQIAHPPAPARPCRTENEAVTIPLSGISPPPR